MGKVYSDIAVSADGFAAGRNQREEAPLGDIHENWLHAWMFDAYEENRAEVDAIVDSGATIMGRNMFGPLRGDWDRDWRGWWGTEPPYHGPVFVLTHFAHDPIEMEGGTTFHFVTDGINSAFERARETAGERNISIAGGRLDGQPVPRRGSPRRTAPARDVVHPRCGRAGVRGRAGAGSRARLGASNITRDAYHLPAGAGITAKAIVMR